MSPEKTHPDGWYRLNRKIQGVGRLRVKSGRTLAMHRRVDSLVTKMVEAGRLEELRLLRAKKITAMMLIDADRRNAGVTDPSTRLLIAPLWSTATAVLAGDKGTLIRYRGSFKALQVHGEQPADLTVGDLAAIDWTSLEAGWGRSPSDWNHLGRAVSRFLTLYLGEHHAFRVELMKVFPEREEVERLVELSPTEFAEILKPADELLQHCYYTLAATGLRTLAEYRKLKRESLGNYLVKVRLSKNSGSHRDIPVDRTLWHHLTAAIPCPFKADYLTRHWRILADAAKRPDLVLRDLRHCYGFWSLEAGVPINVVRDAMGHKNLATTQRYLKQRASRDHAAALAGVMLKKPAVKKKRA